MRRSQKTDFQTKYLLAEGLKMLFYISFVFIKVEVIVSLSSANGHMDLTPFTIYSISTRCFLRLQFWTIIYAGLFLKSSKLLIPCERLAYLTSAILSLLEYPDIFDAKQ